MEIGHKNLTDRIHLLMFNQQQDLTSTFLRFQEHYESPEFRGKIFTLEEFKKWYIQNSPEGKKTGNFTYYTDWSGFNIPSYILGPFKEGKFNPLSEKEKRFLDIFKKEADPFYIIGAYNEIENLDLLLEHEIAHGLFYTDEQYRKEVNLVLSKFDIEPIKAQLRLRMGYHEDVLDDECHAYGLASTKSLDKAISQEFSENLRSIYDKYLKINGIVPFK